METMVNCTTSMSGASRGHGRARSDAATPNHVSLTVYFDCISGYVSDANGNIIHVTDDTCSLVAQYEYGPFGETTLSSGAEAESNPFRFSSKYRDTETLTYYYGFRSYRADMGRWKNRDPIGENGGMNLYCFVGNACLNRMDRLGQKWYWPPDWFKERETKKHCMNCCCCAEKLEVDGDRETSAKTFGHWFNVTVGIKYKHWDGEFADCRFEWWEWSENESETTPAQDWTDVYDEHSDNSVFKEWNARKRGCLVEDEFTMDDHPGIDLPSPYGADNRLYIGVKLISAKGCECDNADIKKMAYFQFCYAGGDCGRSETVPLGSFPPAIGSPPMSVGNPPGW